MITRAAAGAVIGTVMATAALAAFTLLNPAVVFDFDADLPRPITAGFYPVERTPAETFAWTSTLATISLRGIDRDDTWRCTARMRGGRPAGSPAAETRFGVDGVTVATQVPGAAYEDIGFDAPPKPGARTLSLTISTSPPFVPGATDARELGAQIDRIGCLPAAGSWTLPPAESLVRVAAAGAAFGLIFALLTPTLLLSLIASAVLGAALGLVVNTGVARFSRAYLDWILPLAFWITAPLLLFAVTRWRRRRPLHPAVGFVLLFSSSVMFVKILTLLHPSKDVVDAVFHAHRLEWVLGGRYYFTQPMPGGVQFPYAIGLYVTAAPWAALVRDHVALLRIVVCAAEAIAGGLLYVAVARAWNDRLAGALAVVLYHLAPLPYVVIGNANLTYAFAQSAAAATMVAAAALPFGRRSGVMIASLFAIASLAFLSHVGIFPVLALALMATGILCWILAARTERPAATGIVVATVLAACFAVGSYYAHFPEVYAALGRVTAAAPPTTEPGPSTAAPDAARPSLTMGARAVRAADLGAAGIGWPLIALAIVGAWVAWRAPRDRLSLALGGMGVSFAVFLMFRVIAPVDARYQRYADEFIERLYYATLPAIAILAGLAAARGWRGGVAWRLASTAGLAAAAVLGIRQWLSWIR